MAQGDYLGIVMQSDVGAQGENGVAPLASPALTGTPTAPTAADGTATAQIATTAFVKSANKWQSNPNLLDNWFFVGGGSQQGGGQFPINQRGQTSYSGTGYMIDRWACNSNYMSIAIAVDYVTLSKTITGYTNIHQVFPASFWKRLSGKQVTISFLTDTTLVSATEVLPTDTSVYWDTGGTYRVNGWYADIAGVPSNNTCGLRILNDISDTPVNIIAAKLELGDKQTLAHQENGVWVLNEIPNYQQELAKCQRYQEASSTFTYAVGGSGNFDFSVPFKVTKRNSGFPVTVYSNAGTPNAVSKWTSDGWTDVPITDPVSGNYSTREDCFRLIVPNAGAYAVIEFHFFADNNL